VHVKLSKDYVPLILDLPKARRRCFKSIISVTDVFVELLGKYQQAPVAHVPLTTANFCFNYLCGTMPAINRFCDTMIQDRPPLRSGNSENGKDISFTFKGAITRAHRRTKVRIYLSMALDLRENSNTQRWGTPM
jgi:hypothetical protein